MLQKIMVLTKSPIMLIRSTFTRRHVKASQSVFASKYRFSFIPFTYIVEDNVKEEQVVGEF